MIPSDLRIPRGGVAGGGDSARGLQVMRGRHAVERRGINHEL